MSNFTSHQSTLEAWLTWTFSPTISAILVTLLVSLLSPIIIHLYLYNRRGGSKDVPTFLLIGPSGSGKTTLLTLFANSAPTSTHTSQTPTLASCALPSDTRTSADKYRSENDVAAHDDQHAPTFSLLDTPGHGKLRHHAFSAVAPSSSSTTPAPRGVIFVIDSAAPSLTEAGEYLHDVLLALQKRYTSAKSSKRPSNVPVLVAANKQDLFTALPPAILAKKLQAEITQVRETKSRGVTAAGGGGGATLEDDEEENWLGEFGSRKFEFDQMGEYGVDVTVLGGNVRSADEDDTDGRRVSEWWAWIGENL